MNLETLSILGLSNGEIKVYSAILHLGISSINDIHEKVAMERRAIYDIVNKLIGKGLVTYTVERGKRTYQCAPPNIIKNKIKEVKDKIEEAENLVPEIESAFNISKPNVNFEVFRGKKGIKSIFEDMLNYSDTYHISGKWYVLDEMKYYWINYNKRRIAAKVKWHHLALENAPDAPTSKLLESRTLPKEFNGSSSVVWIYGNKVVNVVWAPEFVAFSMESKQIAENYKKYFDYLWKKVAK